MRSLLAAVAAVALAACGTSSGSEPRPASPAHTPAEPSQEEGLRVAVKAYSDWYLGGRADAAYTLLSARCQERLSREDFAALVRAAEQTYGELPIRELRVDALAGGMARVTYSYDVPALTQTSEPWVREAGIWKQDDC